MFNLAGTTAIRPVQRGVLRVRADVGDSKNMKAENKQAQAPEAG